MQTQPYTNRSLKRLYAKYNRKYFDGRLPPCRVEFHKCVGAVAYCWAKESPARINIDPKYRSEWNYLKITLLHEMVHVAVGEDEFTNADPGPLFREKKAWLIHVMRAFDDLI